MVINRSDQTPGSAKISSICQSGYLTKLLFIIDVAKAPQYDHHHPLAEANGNVAACVLKPGWK